MKAPKIQRIGKKIPKKNIHPCPFRSVISPSVNTRIRYRIPAPIPIPHHMIPSFVVIARRLVVPASQFDPLLPTAARGTADGRHRRRDT